MARKRFDPAVENAITQSAQKHGLSVAAMKAFARIESGGRPNVQTGSYKGLFQLSNKEFTRFGGGGKDIFDPVANADAAGAKLASEAKTFEKRIGRAPTPSELYMIHQQGEGGALKHRQNPDRPAWQNMADTGEGRKKGEAWAKKAISGNIPKQELAAMGGDPTKITSKQFMDMWTRVMARQGEVSQQQMAQSIFDQSGGGQASVQVASAEVPTPERKPMQAPDTSSGLAPDSGAGAIQVTNNLTPDPVGAGKFAAPGMNETAVALANEVKGVNVAGSEAGSAAPAQAPQTDTIATATTIGQDGQTAGGLGGGGGGGLLGLGGGGAGAGASLIKAAQAQLSSSTPAPSYEAAMAAWDPKAGDANPLLAMLPPPPPRTPPDVPVLNRKRRSFA